MLSEEIRAAREKASAELLTDFFKLADEWELNLEEQKVLIGEKSIDRLLRSIDKESIPLINDDAIARLVMITGIRNDLHILFPKPRCHTYLRSQNNYFEGKSPLDVMLDERNEGITRVQAYLKGTILGGYS